MGVYLDAPNRSVHVGTTTRSQELIAIASAGAVTGYGDEPLDIDLDMEHPFWLNKGDIVKARPAPGDADEGGTHPYAQVVWFPATGGVMVVHPETGAGIYPPELLELIDAAEVPPDVLDQISQRVRPERGD